MSENTIFLKKKYLEAIKLYQNYNKHYYDKLIDNFKESCDNLLDTKEKTNYNKWAIDQNWSKLQEKDNWFIFNPTLAYQMDDYSDIEGKNVDYRT